MFKTIRLLLMAIPIIFSSCHFIPQNEKISNFPDPSQWILHQQRIRNLSFYQARGAIIYISDQKRFYVQFFLQKYEKNYYRLLLTNPIGGVVLKLDTKLDQMQIWSNKKEDRFSNRKEGTIFSIKNNIPLRDMYQWLLGLPGRAIDYKLNNQSLLREITYIYNGELWKVIYQNYSKKTQPSLPIDIRFYKGKECIKLKINDWVVK